MKRVTLKDIALKIGVTPSTVSAALNGTGRIGDEKREMIRRTADEMGFRPNFAAKLLNRSDNNILGLIVSDLVDQFAGHGVYSGLQKHFISTCNTGKTRAYFEVCRENRLPVMLSDGMPSGVLHTGCMSDELRKWVEKNPRFPFVSIEEPGEYSVISEFTQGVCDAVKYLVGKNHKRIALICGPEKYDIHNQSINGFKQGLEECGLELIEGMINTQENVIKELHDKENIAFFDKLLAQDEKPDALILSGRRLITTAMNYLPSCGVKIPEDVSIVGICTGWEAEMIYPGITAVERNVQGLAEEAIKLLNSLIDVGEVDNKNRIVTTNFTERSTVIDR